MSRVEMLRFLDSEVLFFGTVKGLVSERESLRREFEKFSPDHVLLGISPEELSGLKRYLEEPFEIEPDDYEVIYAKKLERYGEVGLPVPTYLEVFSLLKEREFEVIPIDMPDEDYSNLFVSKVDFLKLLRHDMRKRKIWKMPFDEPTPEDFVFAWDREVNRIREFREIEEERERYMASKVAEFLRENGKSRVMVILELERMRGVIDRISSILEAQPLYSSGR